MRSDCHIHLRGNEKPDAVLRAMDTAKLDLICVISQPPMSSKSDWGELPSGGDRARMEEAGRIVAAAPDRIRGFYWLDPLAPDAVEQVERALSDFGIRGVKIIPDHFYVYEERFFPLYERIQSLGAPVLFHVGILWGNADSSRFCRPVDLEVMQRFPRLRWMMAHVAWPWTDECIAVADRFKTTARLAAKAEPHLDRDVSTRDLGLHDRTREVDVACKVDLTPGTPAAYRREVLARAYAVLGADMLLFGTDTLGADDLSGVRAHQERDERIFREIGLSGSDVDRILGTNVLKIFEPMKSA